MMSGRPGGPPHCVFCRELVPEQEVGNVGNGSAKEHRNECSLCDLEWRYPCQSRDGHNGAGNRGRGAAKAENHLKREDQLNDRNADDMRHIRQERSKREERSVARTHDEGEEPHHRAPPIITMAARPKPASLAAVISVPMKPDLMRPAAKNSPQTIRETTLTRILPMPSKKSLKEARTSRKLRRRISSKMIAMMVEITIAVTTSIRI